MANNSSLVSINSPLGLGIDSVIFVQVFVSILLCINFTLIITFFLKDTFYTNMRYILFATTLMSDSVYLIVTNVLLILTFFRLSIQVCLCIIIYIVSSVVNVVTSVTLTAMTLERYVALCMPLRHAELCTVSRALQSILIIHFISLIPCFVILMIFFCSTSVKYFNQNVICYAEVFILHSWQSHLKSAMSEFYVLIMFVIIAFSYVKIMKVAKAASGENRKSTQKGLRTVLLHAFQLLLSLIWLLCPFIEVAVLQKDVWSYLKLRYFNYIMFNLAPRCLSPLIYGVRDEAFLLALKMLCSVSSSTTN